MRVNVSEFINEQKLSAFQVMIISLCGLIALIDGYDTQAIAFAAPVIAQVWGVPMSMFGSVFGAGLFGLMVGSMLFGPVADRIGRKRVILISLLIVGLFSLMTVLADTMTDLLVFRFLTGIGLGGIIPNILALTAEYSPRRIQNTLVTVMFCGFPFGAVVGGLVMSGWIPVYGWTIVFYVGGVLPLLIIPIVWKFLPESIQFLINRGSKPNEVTTILHKINPTLQLSGDVQYHLQEERVTRGLVKHLFLNGMASKTLLIWLIYFMNLLILYSMVNWLPSILKSAGFPLQKAIISTVLFNLGGIVGGITLGRLIDRKNSHTILSAAYGLGAAVIMAIGLLGHSIPLLLTMVFLAGFFTTGSLLGVQAITTSIYPTSTRATGVGWAIGIGRVGSIIGPMVAGLMLALQLELSTMFMAIAVPALVAMLAMAGLKETG